MAAAVMADYSGIRRLTKLLCGVFFRELEIVGSEQVPEDRGVLLIAWHPNGMLDPLLMVTSSPRHPRFGARHGIFRWPVLGMMLRRAGVVPLYRAIDLQDPSEASQANQGNAQSLAALAQVLVDGGVAGLFPEGVSHDAPHPQDLRTGAARIYFRARTGLEGDQRPPVIVPVGLHYDRKALFRSKAMVVYHPPLALPAQLDVNPAPDEDQEQARRRARALTELMERELQEVVMATEDWQTHHLLHRVRKMVRAERSKRQSAKLRRPDLEERLLGFRRVWEARRAIESKDPAKVEALRQEVEEYQEDLRALRLKDHELDHAPRLVSFGLTAILLLQVVFVHMLMPPLLLVGYAANGPTVLLLILICRVFCEEEKDVATVKLLVGTVLFPLTWLGIGLLAGNYHRQLLEVFPTLPGASWAVGLSAALMAVVGGALALRNLRLAQRIRRAARVRLTRGLRDKAIDQLLGRRAEIHDQLMAVSEGLDLPGTVGPDGRIRADARDAPGALASSPSQEHQER